MYYKIIDKQYAINKKKRMKYSKLGKIESIKL